jgi:eukaryotic-like serine/threonine-protein kinase
MTDAIGRLRSALADRYRLERELGRGGMATVYLAEDLKHKRKVAVKVLKPELSAVLGAERFMQEIATTAALQHPHILPLFDSGEAGGLLYYVMPFVEGETLRARLDRERQLAVDTAIEITRVVAGALDFAHRRGIIHRDIKPENVLLQDGVPLVADFGIALAVSTAGGDRLTETGLSLGTPAYMSPEQAAGERELDARSDVYALGCMTYELLAGDPPFLGSSPAAVIARHMADPAPPITTVRRNVSPVVAAALARALQKAPADRYPSAGAFAAALRAESAEAPAPVTIVVLPFVNRSQDPDDEYFSDGLTEEIITDLSQVRALRVLSRNSAMMLKGTTKDVPTLAGDLGVSHVVTGSVRRAGNALRVTAELVEARSDTSIWSGKYAGSMDDVFGIQEEIARKLVAALELTLTESEMRQVGTRPVNNAVAYDCYLRARTLLYAWTPDSTPRAIRSVDEAIAIAGETPLLLATKAQLLWNEVNIGIVAPEARYPEVTELVTRALARDSRHALAIFVRGLMAGSRGQTEEALADLYRAHDEWPSDGNIITQLCRYANSAGLRYLGSQVERLALLDPLSQVTQLVVSTWHWANGRFAEAAEAARRCSAIAPPGSVVHLMSAWRIAVAGHTDEAIALMRQVLPAFERHPMHKGMLFWLQVLEGDREGALRLSGQEAPGFTQNELAAIFNADLFAMLGEHATAIQYLRTAVDLGFINYPFLAEYDPLLREIRKEPAFQELLVSVRPRWEAILDWERRRQS